MNGFLALGDPVAKAVPLHPEAEIVLGPLPRSDVRSGSASERITLKNLHHGPEQFLRLVLGYPLQAFDVALGRRVEHDLIAQVSF